jgi:hypothetical protein
MRILMRAATIAAVLAVVGLWFARVRRHDPIAERSTATGHGSSTSSDRKPPAAVRSSVPAKRQAHRLTAPSLVRASGSQSVKSERLPPGMDAEMESELQPAPAWPGPWPKSVADLPHNARTETKLAQFQSVQALDYMLGLLARVRSCVGTGVKSSGGIFVELWFDVEASTAKATGSRVAVFQSALDLDDDPLVVECLERSHVGHSFIFEPKLKPPESESDGYVIRQVLNVPLENEPLYSALLRP